MSKYLSHFKFKTYSLSSFELQINSERLKKNQFNESGCKTTSSILLKNSPISMNSRTVGRTHFHLQVNRISPQGRMYNNILTHSDRSPSSYNDTSYELEFYHCTICALVRPYVCYSNLSVGIRRVCINMYMRRADIRTHHLVVYLFL